MLWIEKSRVQASAKEERLGSILQFDNGKRSTWSKMERKYNPPGSKASRELANSTERKNLHTPVCGVKEFVCMSVLAGWFPQITGDDTMYLQHVLFT